MAAVVAVGRDFSRWREVARGLLAEGVSPEEVLWEEGGEMLLGLGERVETRGVGKGGISVSKEFVRLAQLVGCHRDPERWGLLYRVLWRIVRGERELLRISVDDDVHRLRAMERAVRFDRHKMTAFVRFREVRVGSGGPSPRPSPGVPGEGVRGEGEGAMHYVAWYRPDHYIVKLAAPFFAERFAAMRWSILTRDDCAHWDGEKVTFTAGVERDPRHEDELEGLWRAYYANIFNPARVKVGMMKKEMPVRFWGNLPEAGLIPELLRDAPRRVRLMVEETPVGRREGKGAGVYLPVVRTIEAMREAARACRGCGICEGGTQTVFGEGPAGAVGMVIEEQPGDTEDLAGRVFVGPAGEVLDEALAEVGLDRSLLYVTNAVKHFKFEQRGKRRVHAKPSAREVAACAPWVMGEIEVVRPRAILCLGVTPAQVLLGREFRMGSGRGVVREGTGVAPWVMATWHPSALLRIPEEGKREEARREFVADLRVFGERVKSLSTNGH